MPGEFYVEGKQEKLDVSDIRNGISQLQDSFNQLLDGIAQVLDSIIALVNKSVGVAPVTGSATADWQTAESDVVTIGASNTRYKVLSLLLSIHNLVGASITARLYLKVKGVERKVYEQSFNAVSDLPGLWLVNGTVGIHDALRVTLRSDNAADNGKSVDYDCMLEAMQ
jgi:X-X-X-Leu-X-X-Gly heptad repeat protein